MNILIACEESQRVTTEFRNRGHSCFSCDIIEPSGGHPEWHIQQDCIPLLNGKCSFKTLDGNEHYIDRWDMIIAHPPCTYLATSGNRWFNVEKYGDKARDRIAKREAAINFFMQFINADCDKIAVENPIGYMNSHFRKPDQIIQPYFFGEPYKKSTCLWLKNLPLLKPTNMVDVIQGPTLSNGETQSAWHYETYCASKKERAKIRSKTFIGIAKAFAEQWG